MRLPVIAELNHLSHTSVKEWNRCEHLFWLKRLSGQPYPTGSQGVPASIGSAFDAHVKRALAIRLNRQDDPKFNLTTLLKGSVEPHNWDIAIQHGRKLFELYLSSGAFDNLWNEGIASIELEKTVDITGPDGKTIRIKIKPDALMSDHRVLDFKVNGATSNSGASPKQGYKDVWKEGYQGPHKLYGLALEDIDPDWAAQLAVYTWGYTGYNDVPISAAVEQLAVRGEKVAIASFRTTIGRDFQRQVWAGFVKCWENAPQGIIEEAAPNNSRCIAYNQLCEMAHACEAYQKLEADPTLKALKS